MFIYDKLSIIRARVHGLASAILLKLDLFLMFSEALAGCGHSSF
jgi:hypothetical protein